MVLDAPSTANGLALLTAPRTFAASARVGPIARQGTEIDELVCDPDRTGVVLVATPEEMPVTEAIDLRGDVLRVLDRDVDHVDRERDASGAVRRARSRGAARRSG